MSKYINPFTDFGFKYIFGQEKAKPFLIDFLNEVLKNEPNFEPIENVEYLDKENPKMSRSERGAIYDILCRSYDGREVIVEMQNVSQRYFIDRGIYYTAHAITSQGRPGSDWNFSLRPVYNISFLNFTLEQLEEKVRSDAALCELGTGKPISDKVRFIFIQLPEFKVERDDCKTIFDQWIYILKNMDTMTAFPFMTERAIYKDLESRASYANLSADERRVYESQLKALRDYNNQLAYKYMQGIEQGRAEGRAEGVEEGEEKGLKRGLEQGRAEGRAEGVEEGKLLRDRELASRMKQNGMNPEDISSLLGISLEEIDRLLQ